MPDILIRGLPAEDLHSLDATAGALGLSRNQYLQRLLHAAAGAGVTTSVIDFQ